MSREEFELMALRRVREGGITVQDGGYVHHGHPVTGDLANALVRLRAAGVRDAGTTRARRSPRGGDHLGRAVRHAALSGG